MAGPTPIFLMPDNAPRSNADRPRRSRRRSPSSASSSTDRDLQPAVPSVVMSGPTVAVETPTGFARLGVPDEIDAGLAACGFAEPFAIQIEAIPVALTGVDLCGRARTGSGKTLAFGVPLLAGITPGSAPKHPRALVLVPTRELAQQVASVLEPIAKHCNRSVLAVYGGSSRGSQVRHRLSGNAFNILKPIQV